MQVIEEAQASLFAFKLPAKRWHPKLSFTQQDIAEALIFGPSTAHEIADGLGRAYEDVINALRELRDLGLVAVAERSVDGDVECLDADCEWADSSGVWVEDDTCPACGADVLDVCRWRYFGGKVSDFFLYTQTKGMKDGIQS